MEIPKLIEGGRHIDNRGILAFMNGFNMEAVKRFYVITHPDTDVVRAWQGHKKEQKWFYATAGRFKVAVVAIDNWEAPSGNLPVREFELSAERSLLLHIPGGYANGFKALTPNAQLIVFSDYASTDAGTDDYRFESTLWYNWYKK